ncbi:hypothetical protein ABPG77_007702 [Micractinium sp. CCAP 211/92]
MSFGSGTAGAEGGRRARSGRGCQVPGCAQPLDAGYSMRHRVCTFHYHQESLELDGATVRFCQQCGRYQLLSEFESGRRSCRISLQRHKERRRKARQRKREERAKAKRRWWDGEGESDADAEEEEAKEASEEEQQQEGRRRGGRQDAAEQEGVGEAQLAPAGNRLANTVQSGRVSGQPAARRQPRMTPAVGSDQQQQQQPQLWPHQQEQTQRHQQPDATGPSIQQALQPESEPVQLAWQAQQAALERHADLAQPPMAGRSKHAQQAEHEAKGPQQPAEQPQWLMGIASAVVQSAPPIAALLQPAELLQSPHTPASAAAAEPLHEHLPSPTLAEVWRAHMDDRQFLEELGQPPPLCDACAPP